MDFPFRIRFVDDPEKIEEVLMPMRLLAFPHHLARSNVQRSKERGCSVSFVIVSAALRMPKLHGKKRLRSVECLYLALLINGQDQSLLRRTQVKSHHIHYLLNQQRIIAVLKRLLQMRLKSIPIPDSAIHFATSTEMKDFDA